MARNEAPRRCSLLKISRGARATAGFSTCTSPLNASPYGRRRGSAQAEKPETFVEGGAKLSDQMGPNEVVKRRNETTIIRQFTEAFPGNILK